MKQSKEDLEPNAVNEHSAFVRWFCGLFEVYKDLDKKDYPGKGSVKILKIK